MQFYETLKLLMEKNGVTNYRVAKELGCSASTVATWVNGEKMPSSKYLQLLANYFGVSADYLIAGEDTDAEEASEKQEVLDMLEEIRKNPELRTMFSITRNATPEQLRQYINVIKAIRGED